MRPFTAFFGDNDYSFRLTPAAIIELEAKCGAGVGVIASRLFAKHFAQSDISETIRLALIGGGMAPKRAADLVALYVNDRPLSETYPLAAKVLERLWCGNPNESTNGQA